MLSRACSECPEPADGSSVHTAQAVTIRNSTALTRHGSRDGSGPAVSHGDRDWEPSAESLELIRRHRDRDCDTENIQPRCDPNPVTVLPVLVALSWMTQ